MKIHLSEYIATNNPQEGIKLIVSKGYQKPRNAKMLANQINHLIVQDRKDALMSLAEIHPDRALIEEYLSIKSAGGNKKMNACGPCAMAAFACDGNTECSCNKKMNADGENVQPIARPAAQPEAKEKKTTTEEKSSLSFVHDTKFQTLALVALAAIVVLKISN